MARVAWFSQNYHQTFFSSEEHSMVQFFAFLQERWTIHFNKFSELFTCYFCCFVRTISDIDQ